MSAKESPFWLAVWNEIVMQANKTLEWDFNFSLKKIPL
jgi:hypothetical protein